MISRRSAVVLAALLVGGCAYESSGTTTTTYVAPEDIPPATGPADLVVADQRIEGSAIVLASATMPADGFVVLQADDSGLPGEPLGVSDVLSEGTTANVPVPFFVPIDEDAVVHVTLHVDMDRDGNFTYEPPDAFVDIPATLASGQTATAAVEVVILPPVAPGGVVFSEQQTEGESVTVDAVTLPAPGFVTLREDDGGIPGRIVAVSGLLPEGETTGVVLEPGSPLRDTGVYWIVVYVDRNEDGTLAVTGEPGSDEVARTFDGDDVAVSSVVTVLRVRPVEITVSDQEGDGSAVVVDGVDLPAPGWIEVRVDADGSPGGERLGRSELLDPGATTEITIRLDPALEADGVVWLQVRIDADSNGSLSPEDPLGETVDGDPLRVPVVITFVAPDDNG